MQKKRRETRFERSMSDMAKEFPVSEQTFRSWHLPSRRVPADRCILYCELTGENLWDVRPDIYPKDAANKPIIDYVNAVITKCSV